MKAFVILAFVSGPALAYGPCDEDVQKLCNEVFHEETDRTCLHKKIEQLSSDCKAFVKSKDDGFRKNMASWAQVKSACSKPIEQLCADVKAKVDELVKPIQVCLMMESEKLSLECKKEMNRHIKEFQPNIREIP